MKFIYISFFLAAILLTGCHKEIPKPKTELELTPVNHVQAKDNISVFRVVSQNDFSLEYYVKDSSLLVECKIPEVSFRQNKGKDKAKIVVYIDGEKKQEVTSAAFIIKGLPKGNHKVKLEVVGSNFQKSKQFDVNIP